MKPVCTFLKAFFHKKDPVLLFLLIFLPPLLFAQQKDSKWLLVEGIHYNSLHPSQKKLLDSTLNLYHQAKHDSTRLRLLDKIVENCNDDAVWPLYNAYMLKLATEGKGEKFYLLYQAAALNNLGFDADNKGNVLKAIEYYNQALKIREQAGDKKGIAESINNLGTLYSYQNDLNAAVAYYKKAVKLYQEIGDRKGAAQSLNNLGSSYVNLQDIDSSIAFNLQALQIQKENRDSLGMSNSFVNLGGSYEAAGDTLKAIRFYEQSLQIRERLGSKSGMTESLYSLGGLYFEKKDEKKAKLCLDRSLQIALELGFPKDIENAAHILYKIYRNQHNPVKTLEMYQLFIRMRDSTNGIEQVREATSSKYKWQETQLKLEHDKQTALAVEENKKQKLFLSLIACIAFAISIITVLVFKNLQRYKKAKRIIEKQKEYLEEKQKEILDSIRYAKRIQDAVLKEQEHVSPHLPSHFILFQPKDIVSGDFYWGIEKDAYWYIAAADCTGHGVPGAFLTILGTSFLNELNAADTLYTPAELLDKLRDRIIAELSVTNNETNATRDGMDISLARLHLKTNELMWAGANNPLWIIYHDQEKLSEIPAHKQPIGFYPTLSPYPNHTLQLQKGDIFYLFTDGYADQFGGTKGKKLKYKKLAEILVEIRHEKLERQKELLLKTFIDWKGPYEQTDDVCIMGVKI